MSDRPSKNRAQIEPEEDHAPEAPVDTAAIAEQQNRDALAEISRTQAFYGDIPPASYGTPEGQFAARINQARFEHREQGHDSTMTLIDDLYKAWLDATGKTAPAP